MKKILASIGAVAFAFFIVQHNEQLKIVQRLDAGTLEKDVRNVHTNKENGEFFLSAFASNMSEMRRYKTTWQCASGTDKSKCKKSEDRLQTASFGR